MLENLKLTRELLMEILSECLAKCTQSATYSHMLNGMQTTDIALEIIDMWGSLRLTPNTTQSSGPLSQLANTDPTVFIFTEVARGRYLRE